MISYPSDHSPTPVSYTRARTPSWICQTSRSSFFGAPKRASTIYSRQRVVDGGTCLWYGRVQLSDPKKDPRTIDLWGRLTCCLRFGDVPSCSNDRDAQEVNRHKAVVTSSQSEQLIKRHRRDNRYDGKAGPKGLGADGTGVADHLALTFFGSLRGTY